VQRDTPEKLSQDPRRSDPPDVTSRGSDPPAAFTCPRCGREVVERFWGPCASCRDELVRTQVRVPAERDAGRFEPAMHVVPNQVATKE